MPARTCKVAAVPSCGWFSYGKHSPFPGMTREDTVDDVSRYLPGYGPREIEAVETGTVRTPERRQVHVAGFKAEYLREMGTVIGWDDGEDATLSFAECSGGDAQRSFHGRPVSETNPKIRGWK